MPLQGQEIETGEYWNNRVCDINTFKKRNRFHQFMEQNLKERVNRNTCDSRIFLTPSEQGNYNLLLDLPVSKGFEK